MRTSTCLAVACVVATAAIGACGNSNGTGTAGTEGTGDTGTGGQIATSTSATTGATGGMGGAGTTSSSAASTGSGSMTVNGCDPAMAMDQTGLTAVTINFGGITLGSSYDHPCIKVSTGTKVTFAGDFTNHPLGGGDMPPVVDATSPIKATTTGMSAVFTLSTAGVYGYFCQMHYSTGMEGAVIVQ